MGIFNVCCFKICLVSAGFGAVFVGIFKVSCFKIRSVKWFFVLSFAGLMYVVSKSVWIVLVLVLFFGGFSR